MIFAILAVLAVAFFFISIFLPHGKVRAMSMILVGIAIIGTTVAISAAMNSGWGFQTTTTTKIEPLTKVSKAIGVIKTPIGTSGKRYAVTYRLANTNHLQTAKPAITTDVKISQSTGNQATVRLITKKQTYAASWARFLFMDTGMNNEVTHTVTDVAIPKTYVVVTKTSK